MAGPLDGIDPRNASAAFNAGLTALSGPGEEEALELLRAAIRHNPQDARLWQVKGLLHRALDDLGPAVSALARAAELAPSDGKIAQAHAHAALEAGLPTVTLFRKALALAPQREPVRIALASAQLAERQGPEAVAELDTVLAGQPEWLEGHWLLARLRWALGDRQHFTASLERALGQAPRHLPFWGQLLAVHVHAEQYGEALEVIGRGRAAAGEHLVFDANEALCRAERGESEAADRLFARLPRPLDAGITIRLLRHLLRTGRPAEAAALGEPLAKGPAGALAWPYVGLAWRLLGDPRWEWLERQEGLVGVYDLGDALPPLPALAERLRSLHLLTSQPLEQSLRRGTQTDGPLFSRVEPELRALRATITAAVERHIAQLPPSDPAHPTLAQPRDRRVRFAGSWSVRLTDGGHHAAHVHPAGWFSSALYIGLPGEAERGPVPAGWLALGEAPPELGLDLEPVRLVEPKPGRLVLFPSIMWHGTVPFGSGERLTVAFDVAPPR